MFVFNNIFVSVFVLVNGIVFSFSISRSLSFLRLKSSIYDTSCAANAYLENARLVAKQVRYTFDAITGDRIYKIWTCYNFKPTEYFIV